MANYRMPEFSAYHATRFWGKVTRTSDDACWVWTASTDSKGYGKFTMQSEGRWIYLASHRVSYFLHSGEDPSSFAVCHSCDNPPCVNPRHLWLGTIQDNSNDMVSKGRQGRGGSSLTQADVLTIRELWASGEYSQHTISRMYGLSRAGVCLILNGKRWKRVPMPDAPTKPAARNYGGRRKSHVG